MPPSDSRPPSATAPVPLAMAYLDAGAYSVPDGPTTRAPANVPCVGDDSPALRKTGMSRGEARASQVTRPSSSDVLRSNTPPDRTPSWPTHAEGYGCLRCQTARSASGKMIGFGAAVPRPARSHADASPTPSLGSAQGLLLARVGSPLARQDSHLLDDERNFMIASQPPIPFDQPCLVALFFLFIMARIPLDNTWERPQNVL
jgi:hypothetical protein